MQLFILEAKPIKRHEEAWALQCTATSRIHESAALSCLSLCHSSSAFLRQTAYPMIQDWLSARLMSTEQPQFDPSQPALSSSESIAHGLKLSLLLMYCIVSPSSPVRVKTGSGSLSRGQQMHAFNNQHATSSSSRNAARLSNRIPTTHAARPEATLD